jgi:hypothetical protein
MCNLNWTWIPGKCLCLMPKFLKYGLFYIFTFTTSTGRTKLPVPNTSLQDSLTTVLMHTSFCKCVDIVFLTLLTYNLCSAGLVISYDCIACWRVFQWPSARYTRYKSSDSLKYSILYVHVNAKTLLVSYNVVQIIPQTFCAIWRLLVEYVDKRCWRVRLTGVHYMNIWTLEARCHNLETHLLYTCTYLAQSPNYISKAWIACVNLWVTYM